MQGNRAVLTRAVDPDPHSFSLLDPDPHSICGSRRENFEEKQKNARKLVVIVSLLKRISKLGLAIPVWFLTL